MEKYMVKVSSAHSRISENGVMPYSSTKQTAQENDLKWLHAADYPKQQFSLSVLCCGYILWSTSMAPVYNCKMWISHSLLYRKSGLTLPLKGLSF